ncbi:DUF4365 domain-containing protein [Streptomyces sp. NPDC002309]
MRPTHLVDRAGVTMAGYLITTRLGWLFREQETSDVGIDAHLEVVSGASMSAQSTGGATGRLLAVQIKSGQSQFAAAADGGWWYPCDADHAAYWTNHSLPVTLLLFDPRSERVYWQHVNADTLVSTGRNYKVFVPAEQQIDEVNAEALARPARRQQDTDPFSNATDRLPGNARTQLLKSHQAGHAHALPLAVFLADADDPKNAVGELLAVPPAWLNDLDTEHEEGAWKSIAAYASDHQLGMLAVRALERAADASPSDRGRILALAAFMATTHSAEHARQLADAAVETDGSTLLVAAARALLDAEGQHPAHLPDAIRRALATEEPAATKDVNILRFAAHCHFAADRHDEGEDLLEKSLRLDPGEPALQLDLAQCLLRRSAVGAPRQAFFDTGRAQRLAQAARAEYRRWRGPSHHAAAILLEARMIAGDITAAIHTVIAEPIGDAQGPETSSQTLLIEAVRLAYMTGQADLATTLAARLTGDGEKLQLQAYACEADPTADRESCIAAWEAATTGATTDDQRATAAFALANLGVWPVPHLDHLREQGAITEALYQTRWAASDAARGESAAAIRRLREWESNSVVAAMKLVDQYERQDELMLAAEAAERAGRRFGETYLRALAVDLWDRSGQREQARIRALTLLGRPFLPAGMRGQLRRMVVQWAYDRADWSDMEDHALVGLAEHLGIEHVTSAEGAAGTVPQAALPFAWAAIHAQLRNRNLERARDTLVRFAPQVRNSDDVRAWLALTSWSGWTVTLAATALDLAERYRSEDLELSGALLGGILTATGEPPRNTSAPTDTGTTEDHEAPHCLVLPEPLGERLRSLLADLPQTTALTSVPGGAQGLVQLVEKSLGPNEALVEAAVDSVRVGALTTGMLAWAVRRPVALVLLQRAAGFFPACSLNATHITAEIEAVRRALEDTAVLDVSVLALTAFLPGRLDQMRAAFASTPTPIAVCDDVMNTRYLLHETLRASGLLGVWGGRVFLTEYTEQDRQEARRLAAALSRVIPTLQPVDVPDLTEIRHRLSLPNVPHETDAAWLSAAQHALDIGAALWCDDAILRDLLIQAGIPTFGTVALLHVLSERGYSEFNDERLADDIRTLLASHVVDLPVTGDLIAETAAEHQWKPAPAAVMFSRPNLWTTQGAVPLWRDIAEKVGDSAPDELGSWICFAVQGVTARVQPESMPQAVIELTAETLLAAGVGPETAQTLQPVALNALVACSEAMTRRHALTGHPVPQLHVPTADEFESLLRSALTRILIVQRKFTPVAATAIVEAAMPQPSLPPTP